MGSQATIYLDTNNHGGLINKLKKIFKSYSVGFLVGEGAIYIITHSLSASAFTGLMGALGGLAAGSAILFGLIPFLFGFLWKKFMNYIFG